MCEFDFRGQASPQKLFSNKFFAFIGEYNGYKQLLEVIDVKKDFETITGSRDQLQGICIKQEDPALTNEKVLSPWKNRCLSSAKLNSGGSGGGVGQGAIESGA